MPVVLQFKCFYTFVYAILYLNLPCKNLTSEEERTGVSFTLRRVSSIVTVLMLADCGSNNTCNWVVSTWFMTQIKSPAFKVTSDL